MFGVETVRNIRDIRRSVQIIFFDFYLDNDETRISCAPGSDGWLSVQVSMEAGLRHCVSQLEIFDIPSPCVGVCESNNRGYCKGCLRSRDERLYWLRLSSTQKREVIRLCQQRRQRVLRAQDEARRLQEGPGDESVEQGSLF